MINYDQILPELYVGSYPGCRDDIDVLKRVCGITAVLNLQTDDDLRDKGLDWPSLEASYRSIEVRRVPMRDGDHGDQRRMLPEGVRALAGLLASGRTVYLHCNAGVGRSPLVAMAYLYWCRGWTPAEAMRYVEERRPCSPYRDLLQLSCQDLLRDEAVQREIARRAYRLFERRGRRPGDPRQDWADAEREVLQEIMGMDQNCLGRREPWQGP